VSVLLLSMPPLLLAAPGLSRRAPDGLIGGMIDDGTSGRAALNRCGTWCAGARARHAAHRDVRASAGPGDIRGRQSAYVLATLARGVPRARVIWRDALKAALRPIASIYGIVVGTLLSGSFAVEIITSWPGLGRLVLDALRARDVYLVAGCAAAGSAFLAAGTLLSDAALAAVDPRSTE
jgi:hypothetical protein